MKFWKWYLKGILRIPFALISWQAEWGYGILVLIVASLIVGFSCSLLWLALTIPVGTTLCTHSYWRCVEKEHHA
jgi:hypothetical protein